MDSLDTLEQNDARYGLVDEFWRLLYKNNLSIVCSLLKNA